jgi:glycosyltransferase involved in cell wall biosynthesis
VEKRLKIAILVPWIKSKGGVERAILTLLKDDKYDIDVYTFEYKEENTFEEFKNFKIYKIGNLKGGKFVTKGLKLFFNLLTSRIKNLNSYDVFVVSTAGISELSVFRNKHRNTVALSHTPLRVAHTMYDYYRKSALRYRLLLPILVPIYRWLERAAWKRINYALVYSQEVKFRLVKSGLIRPSRIFVIGPAVRYPKSIKKTKTKKLIFYSSRFIPYKRQDLAIRAFRASELPKLGFKLVLGGFVEDKRYFERIKALAGQGNGIILKTNMKDDELKALYSECYATLFLSVNEDTGLVPLESMAYGKPVISVNEGGPKEFVKNGVNGLLVTANINSIAAALNRIINKKLYLKLKSGALTSTIYDDERQRSKFDKYISRIANKRIKAT